jgi:predicted hotdog family 3-hydroxylacyl-ACP dehydratase
MSELLPHEGRAILLDAVTAFTPDGVECLATITADFPCSESGGIPSLLLLELMAQAAGAYAHLSIGTGAPRAGYVVGFRNVELRVDGVPIGTKLSIAARPSWSAGAAGRFECEARQDDSTIATAQLTVFQP